MIDFAQIESLEFAAAVLRQSEETMAHLARDIDLQLKQFWAAGTAEEVERRANAAFTPAELVELFKGHAELVDFLRRNYRHFTAPVFQWRYELTLEHGLKILGPLEAAPA